MEFIQISLTYDCRNAILDAPTKKLGEGNLTEYVCKLLETEADVFYQRMLNGERVSSNLAHPYIFLYEMMKQERKLILQYQEEIKKLGQQDSSPT